MLLLTQIKIIGILCTTLFCIGYTAFLDHLLDLETAIHKIGVVLIWLSLSVIAAYFLCWKIDNLERKRSKTNEKT